MYPLNMNETKIVEKFNNLIDFIKVKESALVAFSGGVDSSLLVYACMRADIKLLAVNFHSYLYDKQELLNAISFLKNYNINYNIFPIDPLNDIEDIRTNPKNRCYLCKKYLFRDLNELKTISNLRHIYDGSNKDDMQTHRPGMIALKEYNVISPLAELGYTKQDVRDAAKLYGLVMHNKPSLSCFMTRFEYDKEITIGMIKKINHTEKSLIQMGLTSARCRVHGDDTLLRIELSDSDMIQVVHTLKDQILVSLDKFGYKYISIDLAGSRSGSMDL